MSSLNYNQVRPKKYRSFLVLGLFLFIVLLANPALVFGLDFFVNSAGDEADENYADGICQTANPGECTLRAALEQANSTIGLDRVLFTIPPGEIFQIAPTSALPPIQQTLQIEAPLNANGLPRVVVDGLHIGGTGLQLNASGNQISGLSMIRFSNGIWLQAEGQLLRRNFIGIHPQVNQNVGNQYGIRVSSSHNQIGRVNEGNIISGNISHGIFLEEINAHDNTIQANFIGTNSTGIQELGNGGHGIEIINASRNLIGGNIEGQGNVISGNEGSGIVLEENTFETQIEGNFIGTNQSTTLALPNRAHGIVVNNSSSNHIGGREPDSGNVISGNGENGILFLGANTSGNTIESNIIGLNANGTETLSNGAHGIYFLKDDFSDISGPSGNFIGGPDINARNIISGNTQAGIRIEGEATSQNRIQGNFIGTNIQGSVALGNGSHGVWITAGSDLPAAEYKPGPPYNNFIGGREGLSFADGCQGACNLISGNLQNGVLIDSARVTGHRIEGNYIGTDITGAMSIPNEQNGVRIAGANSNYIGGIPDNGSEINQASNLISGNGAAGISIFGPLAKQNKIYGNYIGTDKSGRQALPNRVGVLVEFNSFTEVGNNIPLTGNLISGNLETGARISQSHNTLIHSNRIGLQEDGLSPLGNGGAGIEISQLSTGNTVGGLLPEDSNHIAFNLSDGIQLIGIKNNQILANSIHNNEGLGILRGDLNADLETETSETLNNIIARPYPELHSVIPQNFGLLVEGNVVGVPNSELLLQFYANELCDSSGLGEGHYFLGSYTIISNEEGQANFFVSLPRIGGDVITATVTDSSRNTSEFSWCRLVGTGPNADLDEDNILNTEDNCPETHNFDQQDSDLDGVGNLCDICEDDDDRRDFDFNGVPDCLEISIQGSRGACQLSKISSSAQNHPILKNLFILVGFTLSANFYLRRYRVS